jgi:hypothetical protein
LVKTKERSAAGGGRTAAATPQGGDRLPFAPRERKPALAALAVLLILIGALGATVLVLRASDQVAGILITKPIAAGQEIPEESMKQVMVPKESDINFTPWSQRGALGKYRAKGDIPANSPLVGEMLSEGAGIESGKAVVGLSLKPGQFPNGLADGNTVAAYDVGDKAGQSSTENDESTPSTTTNNLLVENAKVQKAVQAKEGALGGGGFTVTLLVDQEDVGALSQAASNQEVALVLVRGNDN